VHEGLRKLLPADSPQDPFPLLLELLLSHGDARQLLLQLGEEEVVGWSEVRSIAGVREQFDVCFREELLHNLRGVDWGVVPVEEPLPLRGLWPLFPQILQEGPQGSDDIFRIGSVPPGEVVCVHHTLGV
jgi:hypothetical protein